MDQAFTLSPRMPPSKIATTKKPFKSNLLSPVSTAARTVDENFRKQGQSKFTAAETSMGTDTQDISEAVINGLYSTVGTSGNPFDKDHGVKTSGNSPMVRQKKGGLQSRTFYGKPFNDNKDLN